MNKKTVPTVEADDTDPLDVDGIVAVGLVRL
jgi:hypothetical protein